MIVIKETVTCTVVGRRRPTNRTGRGQPSSATSVTERPFSWNNNVHQANPTRYYNNDE